MRRVNWYLIAGVLLILLSLALFDAQYMIFHRVKETFFYLLQDLAFLPIEIVVVTLLLNRWLRMRAREDLLHKMNAVVGVFFTEMGSELLRMLSAFDSDLPGIRAIARMDAGWTDRDFQLLTRRLDERAYSMVCPCADLQALKLFLHSKRDLVVRLLCSPNLLENTSFTQLLWAVSHLDQELEFRTGLDGLPDADYAHLALDVRRAYVAALREWVVYVMRLRVDHPYMFSLVARMDPFDPNPSAVIRDMPTASSGQPG